MYTVETQQFISILIQIEEHSEMIVYSYVV